MHRSQHIHETAARGLRRRTLLAGVGLAATGVRAGNGWEWRPWPSGRAAPVLDLPLLDGGRWRAAERRGRVLLVNFWATWCGPCREEMPSLQTLAQQRAAEGLEVVTVNHRESPAAIRRFAEALPLALPVLLDADGAAARAHGVRIFPSTLVIDRRGRLRGTLVGEVDWLGAEAGQVLLPLLAAR